jgi:hypothetical protein
MSDPILSAYSVHVNRVRPEIAIAARLRYNNENRRRRRAMPYDLDEIIDRQRTDARNTDGFRGYSFHGWPEKAFPCRDEECVRMWTADHEL